MGFFCSLSLAPLLWAAAPLSFNLERVEDRSGDFPLVFYTFRCGSKGYTFCPPAKWRITGNATNMLFSAPAADGEAVARFRISSAAELALLSPDQKERRESILRQNLPPSLTNLRQVGGEDPNPVPCLGHPGLEIEYSFDLFGHALKASVMVCQLDATNGFTLITIVPAQMPDNFIEQVRRTLGDIGVVEDKPAPHLQ